jgi:uncharacterized protein (TIGR02996 family)
MTVASSTEDALLAAICADPADDTVRLVFADFLDEQDDPISSAWATFIRAHSRLVTDTATAGDVPDVLRFGADDWLRQFARRLGVPAISGVRLEGWERGLPSAVTGEFDTVRREWDVLDRVPFRRLHLRGAEDSAVEDFVLWPRLERLTDLDLTGSTLDTWRPRELGERGVWALAACPALAGLERLSFRAASHADRIAELILGSRHLLGLKTLYLDGWPAMSEEWRVRLRARFGLRVV